MNGTRALAVAIGSSLVMGCTSPPRQEVRFNDREEAIAWVRETNKFGADSKMVHDFIRQLDGVIGGDEERATWKIGRVLTKSGRAYLARWDNGKFSVRRLSAPEAQGLGVSDTKMMFEGERKAGHLGASGIAE